MSADLPLNTSALAAFDRCACGSLLAPCPACRNRICYECEDWQRFHSLRGYVGRSWRSYVSRWFVP